MATSSSSSARESDGWAEARLLRAYSPPFYPTAVDSENSSLPQFRRLPLSRERHMPYHRNLQRKHPGQLQTVPPNTVIELRNLRQYGLSPRGNSPPAHGLRKRAPCQSATSVERSRRQSPGDDPPCVSVSENDIPCCLES
jgi:hypothetical protein